MLPIQRAHDSGVHRQNGYVRIDTRRHFFGTSLTFMHPIAYISHLNREFYAF
jgi:hypothetical protein